MCSACSSGFKLGFHYAVVVGLRGGITPLANVIVEHKQAIKTHSKATRTRNVSGQSKLDKGPGHQHLV